MFIFLVSRQFKENNSYLVASVSEKPSGNETRDCIYERKYKTAICAIIYCGVVSVKQFDIVGFFFVVHALQFETRTPFILYHAG